MTNRIPFRAMKRPLIAILRGVMPTETRDVVSALIDNGFTAIEIPLNSPDPFTSIAIAAKLAPSNCLIGAGTVLTTSDVQQLHEAGGKLMVSPNVEPAVIELAASYGMVTMPGVFTATEALLAARSGATGLKFFPASVLGPSGIQALSAVLPSDLTLAAVGGVSEANFADYGKVGIRAFGLGSSIYKIGMSAADVAVRARATVSAYDAVFGEHA
jgi:2-dehydro-3-deoxyphosphogalactonate aldolase